MNSIVAIGFLAMLVLLTKSLLMDDDAAGHRDIEPIR